MPLQSCADLSPADWIAGSRLPWGRLVSMGPSGFAAYARLRFIADPQRPGQSENDIEVGPDAPGEHDRLRIVLDVLGQHTRTPDEIYYAVWDGWGWSPHAAGGPRPVDAAPMPEIDESDPRARPGLAPGSREPFDGPKVRIPARAYHLLHGTLADFDARQTSGAQSGPPGVEVPDPAFIWPADRAWCVANDVDPHYAGIGGSAAAITRLLEVPGLDVVRADPDAEQPAYR